MKIISNHLVYQPEDPAAHQAVFPDLRMAEVGGATYAAVPWTLEATQVLKNMGYEPPHPIRTQYAWPGRFKPYQHQLETAEACTLNPRFFCLNGLGTGKTLAVLWAADYLLNLGVVDKVLVVSPLSTLECVWAREIFVNFPHRRAVVLHGARQKRVDLLREPADFCIINHDGVGTIKEELQAAGFGLVIVDELAAYRNAQTTRWKDLRSLLRPETRVWGLTGTPTPNAPADAYGQMKLVKPENFNGHFTKFKNMVMFQLSAFKWIPRKGSEDVVEKVLSPSIRFALEDCIELPPTIYHYREASLSPEQAKHFAVLQREAVTQIGEKEVTAVNAAVLISKLVQAGCGVVYAGDGEKAKLDFGPRLAVLKECIEEAAAKVIVFVPFTGVLDALHEELKKHWTCAVVDGGVSKTRRDQIFADFQTKSDPHILIANPQAMAHGITLTAADTIIWYAPIYSNEFYEQANARIVRPSQTRHTNIVHIAATSVERKIYETLKEKGRLQAIVLDLIKK